MTKRITSRTRGVPPGALCGCGHPPRTAGTPPGTGYAVTRRGGTVCYDCAETMERRDWGKVRPGGVFIAYLSGDGKRVETWTGAELARVTRATEGRCGFGGTVQTFVRALDGDGVRWYGRGPGRGMYLRLHRCKAPRDRASPPNPGGVRWRPHDPRLGACHDFESSCGRFLLYRVAGKGLRLHARVDEACYAVTYTAWRLLADGFPSRAAVGRYLADPANLPPWLAPRRTRRPDGAR